MVTQSDDTARVEMFSDGVMAIAITLLAIEIDVERENGESLSRSILDAWPLLLAYAISFLQIGIIWANHHNRFRYIVRSDDALLVLNTLFLMGVAFIPVPTKILGEHILGTVEEFRAAAVLYAATLAFTAIWFTWLWLHASRHLLGDQLSPQIIKAMDRRYITGGLMYLVALGVAFFSPVASLALLAGLALRFLAPEASDLERSQKEFDVLRAKD